MEIDDELYFEMRLSLLNSWGYNTVLLSKKKKKWYLRETAHPGHGTRGVAMRRSSLWLLHNTSSSDYQPDNHFHPQKYLSFQWLRCFVPQWQFTQYTTNTPKLIKCVIDPAYTNLKRRRTVICIHESQCSDGIRKSFVFGVCAYRLIKQLLMFDVFYLSFFSHRVRRLGTHSGTSARGKPGILLLYHAIVAQTL